MRAASRNTFRQRAARAVKSIQYVKRACAALLLLGMVGAYVTFYYSNASNGQDTLWKRRVEAAALAMGKPKDMHIKWWMFLWRGTTVPGIMSPEPAWYPCWWGKFKVSGSSRTQFVTLVTAGGSELHRYQVADAVAIAYITNSTLVMPTVREAENEPNAQFTDLYDPRQFVKSLDGIVRVVSRLGQELVGKETFIRTPRMASRAWIEDNVTPLFKNTTVVQVGPYSGRLENSTEAYDEELEAIRCLAAYHSLQRSENIRRLGERMMERVREAAFKTGGKFLAVDMRGGSVGHNAENCPPLPHKKSEGWHIPETENLRKVALAKQRARDSKCAAEPDDMSRFLRALGYPKNTAIYNTASRYDRKFYTFGKHFRNIVTKDYTMPFNEETQFWWTGKSQVESMLDLYMCVHADVFVSAVPGPFRYVVSALRRMRGVLALVRVSTLSLFDTTTLTKDESRGLLVEMFEENLKPLKKPPKQADFCKYPEYSCFCNEPSKFAPPISPPPSAGDRKRGRSAASPPPEAKDDKKLAESMDTTEAAPEKADKRKGQEIEEATTSSEAKSEKQEEREKRSDPERSEKSAPEEGAVAGGSIKVVGKDGAKE